LGHNDAMGEFTWDQPFELAKSAGLIPSTVPLHRFSRGDMADISFCALTSDIVAVKEIVLTESDSGMELPEAKPIPTEPAISTKPTLEKIELGQLKDMLIEKQILLWKNTKLPWRIIMQDRNKRKLYI